MHSAFSQIIQQNKWIISQVLCDILIFAYNERKIYMLTKSLYFFPQTNVKEHLVATQNLPYKLIVMTKHMLWKAEDFEVLRLPGVKLTIYLSGRSTCEKVWEFCLHVLL